MSERIKTELQGLEVPPSASADVDLDTPSRFSITFSPAPHLVITKRTTFDIRVPMSYPSTPPLVNCLDTKLGALVKGGEETVDDTGKVKLALLTFDGSWNHNYTLSHVTWALHEMMKRPDVPTVRVIPCSSPTSQRFTAQEAGHYGRRGHRPTMEDETCAFPKLSVGDGRVRPLAFYAVFDGHGGRRAAEYASKHLHKTLLAAITDGMTVPNALHKACVDTDAGFIASLRDGERDQSGTTACIVVIDGTVMYTGNLGDSRAVVCRGGDAVALTTDQKASSPSEVARIVAADGFVINNRVLGYLAVARALGDAAFKTGPGQPELVSTHPEVTEVPIDARDEFIVLACDGLFDVLGNQEVIDFARPLLAKGAAPQEVAAGLSQEAIDRGSTDNVSVVVVKLGSGPRSPSTRMRAAPAKRGAGASRAAVSSSSSMRSDAGRPSPARGRKGSTTGEIPAMLLAMVAESERAGPTDNPFSRSFGSTSKAAAARHKIVEDSGAYNSGSGSSASGAGGAGAGSSGRQRPYSLDVSTPASRYDSDRPRASPRRPGMSPVVAQAARNRASSREREKRYGSSPTLMTPKIANMSEERKRALSREGARLLESSGVLGTPNSRHEGSGAANRYKSNQTKLDDGTDMMQFLLDDSNFQ